MKLILAATLIASAWAGECDPRSTGLKNTYCKDKRDGWSGGVYLFGQCLSSASAGRGCDCQCYAYDGQIQKCRSSFDSDKDFCYLEEVSCDSACFMYGQVPIGCGCNTNTWVCQPGVCTACPTNTFFVDSPKRCQNCKTCSGVQYKTADCVAGWFIVKAEDTICTNCPAGSICNSGIKTACPSGSYCLAATSIAVQCDTTKAEICREGGLSLPISGCGPGNYYSTGTCTPCQIGTYMAEDIHQNPTCSPCPAGTYYPGAGASACISCSVGLYSPSTGATTCQKCSSGFYQSNLRQAACIGCSKGSFTSAFGSSTCTLCEAGTYSSGIASGACDLCKGRQYSSNILGSTACSTCPQNMTIFQKSSLSRFEDITGPHDGPALCAYCPEGRYTCNCDFNDVSCITDYCGGNGVCPACPSLHYCQEKGQKLKWAQYIPGETYILRQGSNVQDRILAPCRTCLDKIQYANPICTDTNAVCKNCTMFSPLVTYISERCTSSTDASTLPCNVSNGDLRSGIGVCNMCPAGSSHTSESGCQLCLKNTFSEDGQQCIACPAGTGSAQGASACTIICPQNGRYSPSGLLSGCIPIQTSTQQNIVAQWSKLMMIDFGVQLANKAMIVATNSANGNGLLWMMEMGQAWVLFGDEGGGERSLGRITSMSLLPSQNKANQIILIADVRPNYEAGRIQHLTYDFLKGQIVSVDALISENIKWPSGLAVSSNRTIFVADSTQHCIFKLQYSSQDGNYSQVLWRGSPGLNSLISIRNRLNTVWWLLTRPAFMVPFPGSNTLMILMDDVGIWTFRTDQPPSNTNNDLSYVCGGISNSTSPALLLCRDINFQTLGVTGLVATLNSMLNVIVLVSFRTTDEKCGVLSLTQNIDTFNIEMLISGFPSASFRYQQFPTSLFMGLGNHCIFATLGGNIAQVAEIGMGACLCDAGLYCDIGSQSCVQSPVGSYSPSWSFNPIPCNIGYISGGPGGKDEASWCRPCGRNEFTTKRAGALSCEPMCALNMRFSAEAGECVEGCDASKNGEYLDLDEVTCHICPIGSGAVLGSIGKGITAGCPPCQPTFKSTRPGICEPCPSSTTSIFFGATICMPSTTVAAADGLPALNNSKSYPVFLDLAVITSMSVTSGGHIFFADETNVVLKLDRTKTPLPDPVRVATLCGSGSVSLNLIEVSDDGTTLFSTQIGATCIWKTTLSTDGCPVGPWAGICGLAGEMNGPNDIARLGSISSIALMHVEGHTPVLFVSTRSGLGTGCTSIRSISLYDGSITTFLSYDQLQFPFILVPVCHDLEFKLSIPRGTDKIFYSNGGDVTLIELYNGNQTLNNNYGMTASLIFSLNGQGTVCGMASKADGTLVILKEKVGQEEKVDLIIIGPRIWTNGNSEFVNTVDQVAAAGGMIACVGQHIWYTDNLQKSVYESSSSLLSGCIGGFVRVSSGDVCMQVGIGQYSTPDGNVQNCKGGTFGTVGGSLHISCKECPPGSISREGALGCEVCPASQPFASHGSTECTSACPISTYLRGGVCVSCPAGFFGPIGALSSEECVPCEAGSYSNESTVGLCVKCPLGWSSVSGGHTCVVVCNSDKCSSDGLQCKSLTSNWELVTSIFIPQGFSMRAVAVSRGGGVFYSDNNLIQYFLDDCPAHVILDNVETCYKEGVNILPPLCSGCTRGITAMVVSQEFAKGTSHRYLYATSIQTHNVYRFPIVYVQGIVDADATLQRLLSDSGSTTAAFSDVWLVIGNVNGMSGFSDGSFLNVAKFNTPMELDISQDDRFLIISDFNNNRIRLADFKYENVSTILGTGGSCWKRGTTSACLLGEGDPCDIPSCASSKNPIGVGLSTSGETLFVVMNSEDSIASLSSPLNPSAHHNREFSSTCALSLSKAVSGSIETCQTSEEQSRSCMLFKPYDVIAASNNVIYVSVRQGITRIDLNSMACQQIAGSYWDFTRSSRGSRDGAVDAETQTSDARVNQPFRLALAKDRGILYVADMNNGALRRVFLGGRCACPAGSIFLPESQSCYNPSQKWSTRTLVQCPPGQYALEGESTCRNCSDAEILGIHTTAVSCILSKSTQAANSIMRETGFTYAKVIGSPQNPLHNVVGSDWYGSGYVTSPNWDDIFRIDSIVKYSMGKAPGHAPWGGEFGSYTYNSEFNTWTLEENPILKPSLLLPGFWHPCSPVRIDSTNSVCDCSNQVASFDVEGIGSSNSPWHNIRMAAFEAGAKVLLGGSTLQDYAGGPNNNDPDSALSLWSRFMILGSDMSSPTVCSAIGGPCFPVFQHVKTAVVLGTTPKYITLRAETTNGEWNNDGITTLICATGWPAHYSCPNGYTWVAPLHASANVILSKVTSQIACLSCIPGSFSFMHTEIKKITGGPYSCLRCVMGTFSSAVGSTSCIQCPSSTYASMHGATSCGNCPENYWTKAGAQTISACSPCPPGSGNCKTCVFGEYQSMSAQQTCIKCPPGQVSTTANQTTCTPCLPQSFQSSFGMAYCDPCPHGSFAGQSGATACTTCEAACKLTVGGICGQGCGLNFYFDENQCKRCPTGYLNANDPCSQYITSCYSPTPGMYAIEQQAAIGGDIIAECPYGFGPNVLLRGCSICPAGTHAVLGRGICEKCSPGYFSTQANQSSCISCPAGSFAQDKGQTACFMCDMGQYSPTSAGIRCTECSPGHYASSLGSSLCTPCVNGTYQNVNASISPCQECDAEKGFYSGSAATACRFCEGGYVNLSHSSSCVGCGLGMYEYEDGELGTRRCKQCAVGLVNLNERFAFNESFCQPCPSNLDYSPANGSGAQCFTAPPGNIPTLPLKTWFTPCLPGTFRASSNDSCLPCPQGHVAVIAGLQECDACIPGTYANANGKKCISCDNGLFSGGFAATQCIPCPLGTISSDTNAACIPCPVNTFQVHSICQPCEFGTVSIPGSTECQACPIWTIYNVNTQACSGCRAGTYMAYEAGRGYVCRVCGLGTQNPLSGANSPDACLSCGAGFIPTSSTAATGCMTCPLGQREINNISCEKCDVGKSGPNGVICSSCGVGTYASSLGSSACRNCSVGHFSNSIEMSHCSLCQVGTFSNETASTACLTCTSAEDGFAPTTGLSSCIPRTKSCNSMYYLRLLIETPDKDNECIYCNQCGSDEYVIPTQDDGVDDYLIDLVLGAGRLLNSCPGNTTSLGYRCLKNEPVVGMYLSDRSRAGSSSSSSFSGSSASFQDQSVCTELTAQDLVMMDYVLGPTSDCYVGCRYGVVLSGSQGGVYAYTNLYGGNSFESPLGNIFYPRLAPMASEVCARCPLSPCPLNTYRPEYLPGCGPPCGLNPYKYWCVSSDHVNNQGCYLTCKSAPLGAVTSGGSVSGLGTDSSCPWTCLHGWHISENGTGCVPCTVNICESGFVLVSPDQCLTHHTKIDLCRPCPSIEGGNAVGWDAGTSSCIYSCFTGYYNGLQRCISCTSLPDCPIGTFRKVEDCINKGTEPVCFPCRQDISGDLISFTTHGGFSSANCSALCRTGYHTIDKNTGTYVSNTYGFGIVSPDISCRACVISESRPCNGKCSPGYFRNASVISDTLPGSCVKCITNQECGIGRYAPTCSGNGTANVGCHECSPSLLIQNGEIVRQFVSYEDQVRLITTGIVYPSAPFACPSVCVPNFIQDGGGGDAQCISCRVYTQGKGCRAETLPLLSAYAPMQPTPCDFVFSHWNATPSLVWWDNTPSFLPSSFSKGVIKHRAGLCWACPMGTGTLQQDPDLCLILPGYGRASATPLTERIAIPILGPELYLSFQEPRPMLINLLDSSYNMGGGRRLLSQPSLLEPKMLHIDASGAELSTAATTALVSGGVLCPVGAYKNGRGLANCLACPYGTSTISSGSFHLSQCLCNPGWYRGKSIDNSAENSYMECIPCSVDTFRPAGTVGEEGCSMCPQNETTHGRRNATACACKPGFMRNNQLSNRGCVPCAAGTYCAPCFEGQTDCPLEGVQAVACFAHSSSPPGSTSIKNCSCLSGLVPLTRLTNRQAYYCAPVPPNAIYDQVSKMVRCKVGWTEEWSLGQLLGCTLCPMGYFADADPSITVLPLICRPCPKGTFAASKDVIGNCTACLSPQTTVSEASKSPESCGCPLPTSKGPDGHCMGCLSNQYILSGICTNCPLFSISKIGATSRSDCLCMPGYGVDKLGSCSICEVGKYSSSASNNPCKPCPEGSTTQNLGSKTVRNCGATADLCLAGYTIRTNLGCVLTSLLAT